MNLWFFLFSLVSWSDRSPHNLTKLCFWLLVLGHMVETVALPKLQYEYTGQSLNYNKGGSQEARQPTW